MEGNNNLEVVVDNLKLFIEGLGKTHEAGDKDKKILLPSNTGLVTLEGKYPVFHSGSETFRKPESWVEYVNEKSDDSSFEKNKTLIKAFFHKSESHGYIDRMDVGARFNHHGESAGRGDYGAILTRPISSEFKLWMDTVGRKNDPQQLSKKELILFLETTTDDISNGDLTLSTGEVIQGVNVLDLKKMVKEAKAISNSEADNSNNNGSSKSAAATGVKISEEFPELISICLPILDDGLEYQLPVRIALDNDGYGKVLFSIHIPTAERIVKAAMDIELEGLNSGDYGKLNHSIHR